MKRVELASEARRRNLEQLARLGAEVRVSRARRRLNQVQLGGRVGLSRSTISLVERGLGGGLTLDAWQRVALALERPLDVRMSRDVQEEPIDAGHLRIQELLLRTARTWGAVRTFELAARPSDHARSVDVGIRDDRQRRLLLLEAWNTIGDIGGAARSTARKTAEAEALAVALGGQAGPYSIHSCWVVRSTARNRALVRQYPEVFATRFPGRSRQWVAAIAVGRQPPSEPGRAWSGATVRGAAWPSGGIAEDGR